MPFRIPGVSPQGTTPQRTPTPPSPNTPPQDWSSPIPYPVVDTPPMYESPMTFPDPEVGPIAPPLPIPPPAPGGDILSPEVIAELQPSDADAEAGVSDIKQSEWEEMMRRQLAGTRDDLPAGPFAGSGGLPPQPRDPTYIRNPIPNPFGGGK